MFSIELDNNFSSEKINNIYEHEAADNCFLIFIGGEYVQVLDQVMEKVETISKKIGLHPLGLFIPEDNNSQYTNYADGADFPLVICKVCLYYTILYHIMYIFSFYTASYFGTPFFRYSTSSKFSWVPSRFKVLHSTCSVLANTALIL